MLLTKSKYLVGMQCAKWLWIEFNDKARIPEPDKLAEYRFETGRIVGELAKKLFPKGVDISIEDFNESLDKTQELIRERKVLFEASFLVDDLYSRADILVPVGEDEWDMIEVNSGTKVKNLNIHDVSFQKYVCEKAGLKIRKCFLMHLNNEYVKMGVIEPNELFIQSEITQEVSSVEGIKERIKEMFEVINSKECPEFHVDDLKTIEYDNIAKDEFLESLPEENVFQLYRGGVRSRNLYKEGIVKIKDIPESQELTDIQEIQKECSVTGKVKINKEKLKSFIEGLNYPLYYLDFETINPAIPKFDGMKPYQQVPFQYSLHVVEKPNAKLKHVSFLADGVDNPIPKFLQSLKENLGDKGDIIVYNESFEKKRLEEGADLFPEFEDLVENWLLRIKDLLIPFRNFYYYDPKQKGSASIKKVLPVMSDLSYDDLLIGDGMDASIEYERVTFGLVSEKEKEKVREALERYCGLDTQAEIEIINKLYKIIENEKGD